MQRTKIAIARPGLSAQRSTSQHRRVAVRLLVPRAGWPRRKRVLPRGEWLPWLEAAAKGMELSFHDERCQIRAWRFRRGRKMLTRKIIVILFSLTALGLSSCQGNRLNGSTSSSVATVAVDGPENGPDADEMMGHAQRQGRVFRLDWRRVGRRQARRNSLSTH